MKKQSTSHVLMISPVRFGYNAETAVNNSFQICSNEAAEEIQEQALKEFETFVCKLRSIGVKVLVVKDTIEPYTPDSIFPNNWISTDEMGIMCLFPLFAPNRRLERKMHVIQKLSEHYVISDTMDFTNYEKRGSFLEGTGSMVLDRQNKLTYAALSPRTCKEVLTDFCRKTGYKSVIFTALDNEQNPIYHTNVLMCVADKYAIVCLEAIPDESERQTVRSALVNSGKSLIIITSEQMNSFAGNMLQVKAEIPQRRSSQHHHQEHQQSDQQDCSTSETDENETEMTFLVMSSQAYRSLTPEQINVINTFDPIIHSELKTIEANGGGSARCMIAEIFLPLRDASSPKLL